MKKKILKIKKGKISEIKFNSIIEPAVEIEELPQLQKEPIAKLLTDFPNDLLNNIARKINEIIDRLN